MRIGLTGGIACGKSSVSALLAERGAVIIDFDILAREAVAPDSWGLGAVVKRFGRRVLLPDGSLDRAKLGELVFNDAAARRDLNAIVHPEVRRLAEARELIAPPDAVVVHVIPLLAETSQARVFDRVVVVDCSPRTQVKRLMARNDYALDQAQARISAQASRADRLAIADDVLNNDGSPMDLVNQVDNWWRRVTGTEPHASTKPVPAADDGLPIPVDRASTAFPPAPRKGMPAKGSLILSLLLGTALALVGVVLFQLQSGQWHVPGRVEPTASVSAKSTSVTLGKGIVMDLPKGWVVDKVDQANNTVVITHSSFQATYTAKLSTMSATAEQVCRESLEPITKVWQSLKKMPVSATSPPSKGYDQVVCSVIGKRAGTDQHRAVRGFVSVRIKDGLTVSSTLVYNPTKVPDSLNVDAQALATGLVEAQYQAR